MADSVRQQRVNQAILRSLSTLLLREYGGSDLGSIVISRVKVTPDLRQATIYVTAFKECDRKKLIEELDKERGHLRHMLAKDIGHLKFMPQIMFRYDEKQDEIIRVESLLDKIRDDDTGESSEE